MLWNFAGNALPLVAGVMAFPLLLAELGVDRFGLISIAWVLVGYFSLFDLGLSRAVTHVVAERMSSEDLKAASRAAATGLTLMWMLGVLAAAIVGLLTKWLANGLLEMPDAIRLEAVASFKVLAISIPFVIHTAGLRGLLEAQNEFRIASAIRLVLGVGTFAGPLLVVVIGGGLVEVMWTLVIVRLVGWLAHKYAVKKTVRLIQEDYIFDRRWLRPLLTYGGWMTVTNIISPLMVYLDRFVIGAMLSVAAISYYIVPYEIVTRAWVVSVAVSGVLFPLFSASWSINKVQASEYMRKGAIYVMVMLFPLLSVMAYLAPELIGIWLGETFAREGAPVFRWLAAGTLVAAVAQIFFALVQGAGRSDWTGKLHLAEAVPYWLLLLILLERYGIVGAAVAWFARSAADAVALMWLAGKLGREYERNILTPLMLMTGTAVCIIASTFMEDITLRICLLAITQTIFFWFAWTRLVSIEDRAQLKRYVYAWREGND